MANCTSERRNNRGAWAAAATLALLMGGVWGAGKAAAASKRSAAAAKENKAAAPKDATGVKVTAVRFWSLGDVTRISIEVSSDFKYRFDRLSDPDRLFFDIQGARPAMVEKGMHVVPVGDRLLKQIRVAETQPGVTRVVLDLEEHNPPVAFTASQLSNPARLMVEVRLKDKPAPPVTGSMSGVRTLNDAPLSALAPDLESERFTPDVTAAARAFRPPPEPSPAPVPALQQEILSPPALMLPASTTPPPALARLTFPPPPSAGPAPSSAGIAKAAPAAAPARALERQEEPLPAKTNPAHEPSLTRVLGLKLGRVVIDAGHGGHDAGTRGPSGLLEKDVVLDVALRLGALLQQRLGSEVVYTRTDDTYVPLEERTHIANEHKADLFLSIHANSSPYRTVAGVETYYLNFTTSKTALELAAKENAGSQSTIFDLKDVLAKIAMKDKIDESRQFAASIQNALYALSAKNNAAAKNRGVKKAPFVVLIGASMPSVLAEIGFLTNATDEAMLKKPEHRQKIAEALYKGIAAYAATLSHFQVAKRE